MFGRFSLLHLSMAGPEMLRAVDDLVKILIIFSYYKFGELCLKFGGYWLEANVYLALHLLHPSHDVSSSLPQF